MTAETARPEADSDAIVGRQMYILLCVSLASFMIMLDSNIVAVSLASIARDLHVAFADVEWVVSAYILGFAALVLPAGALADRFGRKTVLLVGLVLFTLASLLCGLAPSSLPLNLARALQGIGGALQLSSALAILGNEFRGMRRAKAFAFWGTVVGIAVAMGPIVGGVITSAAGWRWVFFINLPLGLVLMAVAAVWVRDSRDPNAQRLDIVGIVLFGSGLFFLVWALITADADGWSSSPTIRKFCIGGALLASFVFAELMQRRPMIDLRLFRRVTFFGGAMATIGFASSAQVLMTFLPLYIQNGFRVGPAIAGLAMAPFALPLFIFPRIAARLSAGTPDHVILAAGLGIVALGNLAMAGAVAASSTYLVFALGMIVSGIGAGLLNGETARVQISTVPPERSGMASGIAGTTRFVALVMGIVGLGAIMSGATLRSFVQLQGASTVDNAGDMVSRMVAGDLGGMLEQAVRDLRPAIEVAAMASFSHGFTQLLLATAAIASVTAVLAFFMVGRKAPERAA